MKLPTAPRFPLTALLGTLLVSVVVAGCQAPGNDIGAPATDRPSAAGTGEPTTPLAGGKSEPATMPGSEPASMPASEPTTKPDEDSADPAPATAAGSLFLTVGMTVDVAPRTTLQFVRVVSDSRCPKDVQCVWAGEVTIEMELAAAGAKEKFELSGTASKRTVKGHAIELLSYGPCPDGGPAVTPLPGECAVVSVQPVG